MYLNNTNNLVTNITVWFLGGVLTRYTSKKLLKNKHLDGMPLWTCFYKFWHQCCMTYIYYNYELDLPENNNRIEHIYIYTIFIIFLSEDLILYNIDKLYFLHHIMSIISTLLVIYYNNYYFGSNIIITFEIGSASMNLVDIFPNFYTKIIYLNLMTISNIKTAIMTKEYYYSDDYVNFLPIILVNTFGFFRQKELIKILKNNFDVKDRET